MQGHGGKHVCQRAQDRAWDLAEAPASKAPGISSCPRYPASNTASHFLQTSATKTTLLSTGHACQSAPNLPCVLRHVLLPPSLSFPICKVRLLGLDDLTDPLLPWCLNVPVSQSHTWTHHCFKSRLRPAQCTTGGSCWGGQGQRGPATHTAALLCLEGPPEPRLSRGFLLSS